MKPQRRPMVLQSTALALGTYSSDSKKVCTYQCILLLCQCRPVQLHGLVQQLCRLLLALQQLRPGAERICCIDCRVRPQQKGRTSLGSRCRYHLRATQKTYSKVLVSRFGQCSCEGDPYSNLTATYPRERRCLRCRPAQQVTAVCCMAAKATSSQLLSCRATHCAPRCAPCAQHFP